MRLAKRLVLCRYELGCCAIAVGWGYNSIMVIVPVCQRHKIEGRERRNADDDS